MTAAQLALWMGQQMAPDSPQYNCVFTFRLRGPLDPERFCQAFGQLVADCDNLRTVFITQEGKPRQQVLASPPEPLGLGEISEESLKDWIASRGRRQLDLARCCYDAVLLRLAEHDYVFYLNQHHLITDAWGVSVVWRRLTKCYGAYPRRGGAGAEVPSFAAYVAEHPHRESISLPAYWADRRPPAPPRLLGQRSAGNSSEAPRLPLPLGRKQTAALEALARHPELRHWTRDLALYNVLASVLMVYLYRITRREELCMGTPAAYRTNPQLQNLPGQLIEVLPLYGRVATGDTFLDVARRQRSEVNAFLRAARPGLATAGLNRHFNVVLNYLTARFDDLAPDVSTTTRWHSPGHADHNHHLRLLAYRFREEDELRLAVELNASVFPPPLRGQVVTHLTKLIDAIAANPGRRVNEIDFIGRKERALLLDRGRGPSSRTFLECHSEWVRRTPQSVAIRTPERELTYAELDRASGRLAGYLNHTLDGGGRRVMLYLPRGADLLIAMLACWKAGHTYVPVPVGTPAGRWQHIVREADCALILTLTQFRKDHLAGVSARLLTLDTAGPVLAGHTPPPAPPGTAPAYIMYTSGSTGTPKGIVVGHPALANYLAYARRTYVHTERPAFALFTSVGFDLTVTSLFVPLICGGTVVVYPEPADGGPDLAVLDVLRDGRCEVAKMTPSHLALLGGRKFTDGRLRTLILGGEALAPARVRQARECLPAGLRIFNEYGPTEATVGCIVQEVAPGAAHVSIGRPIDGMHAYVLDERQELLPQGVAGELYLGGRGLASGYVGRPDLTDERFVELPLLGRVYHSGDLARLNANGQFEYLGRTDRQLNWRGYRIEPASIELTLLRCPGVGAAAVGLYDDHLLAYYTAAAALPPSQLSEHLRRYLPTYSIPQTFVHLQDMPLTEQGKIDHRALRDLHPFAPLQEEGAVGRYQAPQGEIEELVASIWSEVLRTDRIDIHTTFLDVGGHSLTAIRLAARLSETFDFDVPLHRVFEHPTIARQALYLEQTLTRLLADHESQE